MNNFHSNSFSTHLLVDVHAHVDATLMTDLPSHLSWKAVDDKISSMEFHAFLNMLKSSLFDLTIEEVDMVYADLRQFCESHHLLYDLGYSLHTSHIAKIFNKTISADGRRSYTKVNPEVVSSFNYASNSVSNSSNNKGKWSPATGISSKVADEDKVGKSIPESQVSNLK